MKRKKKRCENFSRVLSLSLFLFVSLSLSVLIKKEKDIRFVTHLNSSIGKVLSWISIVVDDLSINEYKRDSTPV